MITCHRCGYLNPDNYKRCANCAIDLQYARVNYTNKPKTNEEMLQIGNCGREEHNLPVNKESKEIIPIPQETLMQFPTSSFWNSANILILVSFPIIVISGCLALFWLFTNAMCGQEVINEVYSPDRQYKAVVFEHDCGATTSFSTGISIIKGSEKLSSNYGNWKGRIFSSDGHPDWSIKQVTWNTDRSVTINYDDNYEVYINKNKVRIFFTTITIDYQTPSCDVNCGE